MALVMLALVTSFVAPPASSGVVRSLAAIAPSRCVTAMVMDGYGGQLSYNDARFANVGERSAGRKMQNSLYDDRYGGMFDYDPMMSESYGYGRGGRRNLGGTFDEGRMMMPQSYGYQRGGRMGGRYDTGYGGSYGRGDRFEGRYDDDLVGGYGRGGRFGGRYDEYGFDGSGRSERFDRYGRGERFGMSSGYGPMSGSYRSSYNDRFLRRGDRNGRYMTMPYDDDRFMSMPYGDRYQQWQYSRNMRRGRNNGNFVQGRDGRAMETHNFDGRYIQSMQYSNSGDMQYMQSPRYDSTLTERLGLTDRSRREYRD